MNKYKKEKIVRNIEAKILPYTIVFLLVVVSITSMFLIMPLQTNTVSAASTTDFNYVKKITFDHDQVMGTSDYTNIPVLINISSDSDIDGFVAEDFAFWDDDNSTQLAHEIEEYDDSTDSLVAWVNVTTLHYDEDTVIWMYYSDSDSTTEEDITGTWNNHFKMVHHLNETDLDGGLNDIKDSTSNNRDGNISNPAGTSSIDGIASDCFSLNTCQLNITTDVLDFSGTQSFTAMCWVQTYDDELGDNIFYTNGDFGWYMRTGGSTEDEHVLYKIDDDAETAMRIGTIDVDETGWHMVTMTWDGSTVRGYVDHLSDGSAAETGVIGDLVDKLCIGYDAEANADFYGAIDEARIIDEAWDIDEIRTHYNIMNNATNGSFFTLGEQQAGVGSYELAISGSDTDFSWSGEAGDTIWANDTSDGTENETGYIFTNLSATSDNCTDIFIDFSDFDDGGNVTYQNLSIEVINASDGVWDGTCHLINDAGGNVTLNATTWAASGWCQGSNPFPIDGSDSEIRFRLKCTIPDDAETGTFTANDWKVAWKVLS